MADFETWFQITFYTYDADLTLSAIGVLLSAQDSISLDDAVAIADLVWDVIKPLQNGYLGGCSFSVNVFGAMDGFHAIDNIAATISDAEERAFFNWYAEGGDSTSIQIPCFREELLLGSGRDKYVNLANSDVAAFVTAMTEGIPYGDNLIRHVTIGHQLTTFLKTTPKQWWGKKRKRR